MGLRITLFFWGGCVWGVIVFGVGLVVICKLYVVNLKACKINLGYR